MYVLGIFFFLLFLLVLERVSSTFFSLLLTDGESRTKTLARMGVVGTLVNGLVKWFLYWTERFLVFVQSMVRSVTLVSFVLVVMGLLSMLFELQPTVLPIMLDRYNSGIGVLIRYLILYPLQVIEMFFSDLIAVYDGVIWFIRGVLIRVVFQGTVFDFERIGSLARAGKSLGLLGKEFALSFGIFVQNLASCSSDYNSVIVGVDNQTYVTGTVECFEPGLLALDLITPGRHLRDFTLYIVLFTKNICGALDAVLDILSFPLSDINLYKAIHSWVNAVINIIIVTPMVTTQRCKYALQHNSLEVHKLIMCSPDFTPLFNYIATGMRYLGYMVDNWLDITLVILDTLFTGKAPSCNPISIGLKYTGEDVALFGARYRKVVGLTPGMYAITDGISTQYEIFYKLYRREIAVNNWPFPINPQYGIAAVKYGEVPETDEAGHLTTGMLGCECLDTTQGVVITCAIAPYTKASTSIREDGFLQDIINELSSNSETVASNSTVVSQKIPVSFAIPNTAKITTCSRLKISVQSLRWPATRVSAADGTGAWNNAIDDQNGIRDLAAQVQADAAVYVMPHCDFSGNVDPICIKGYVGSSCYPYCMGLHLSGTINQGIVLYDANDWRNKIQYMKRDCGVTLSNVDGSLQYSRTKTTSISSQAIYDVTNDPLRGVASEAVWDPLTKVCVPNSVINSRMDKSVVQDQQVYPREIPTILGESQPFVMAGDVVLTAYASGVEGEYTTKVTRLFGDDLMQYTVVDLPIEIPAMDICIGRASCDDRLVPGKVVVPYAYTSFPARYNPAATSKWGIFYATNPNTDIYSAFADYCSGVSTTFSIVVDSSYGAIRVWKLNGYSLVQQWGNAVRTWEFSSFNGSQSRSNCGVLYNMSVVDIEYLNDYNMAITVLQADMTSFDVERREVRKGATGFKYKVYFINPATDIGPSETMFVEDEPQSLLSEGKLCPAVRRMPMLGSSVAESFAGLVYFVRVPVNSILLFPAVFSASDWPRVTECTAVTLQHTLLLNCGKDLLNLDLAFSAWNRAVFLFYNSFVRIVDMQRDVLQKVDGRIFYVLGAVAAGSRAINSRVDTGAPAGLDTAVDSIDVGSAFTEVSQTALFTLPPWMKQMATMFLISKKGLWLFMRFLEKLIVDYVIRLAHGQKLENGIFYIIYDMRNDVEELVVNPVYDMCDGISFMFGYNNPPATFLRHICKTGPAAIISVFDYINIYFVDMPILACVCRDAQGMTFADYVRTTCYKFAPTNYKGVLNEMILQTIGQRTEMCIAMGKLTNSHFQTAFDPVFTNLDKAFTAVAASFDYFLGFFDAESGTCSNFYTSDYVMAIVPEPVDYFVGCSETDTCRVRCKSELEAFEAEKAVIQATGVDLVAKVQQDVTLESKFFSVQDTFDGNNQMPFEIMAVIELSNCSLICYGSLNHEMSPLHPDRCFSVAGVNANLLLEVQTYCLPANLALGIRKGAVITDGPNIQLSYIVPTSGDYALTMDRIFFLSVDLLETQLTHDLILISNAGAVYILESGVLTSKIFDVKEGAIYSMTEIYVFPGSVTSDVFIYGNARVLVNQVVTTTLACKHIQIDTALYATLETGKSAAYRTSDCVLGTNVFQRLQNQHVSCLGLDCAWVVLIPAGEGYPFEICSRNVGALTCSVKNDPNSDHISSSLGLTIGTDPDIFTISQDNTILRRRARISATSQTTVPDGGVGSMSELIVLMTAPPDVKNTWVSDARISLVGSKWLGDVLFSSRYTVKTTILKECGIDDCSGCQGYLSLQRMCYAASQCAVAKCIGTTINLQRPLCSVGFVVEELLREILILSQSGYNVMVDILGLIIDGSTGAVSKQVEVSFPVEIFFSMSCHAKDIIIRLVAVLMSLVNGLVMKVRMAATAAEILPADDRFNARITMISASLTNMFSQMLLLPVYAAVISQKIVVCGVNGFFAILNNDAFGNMEIVIGKKSLNNASAALVGKCLTDTFNEDVRNLQLKKSSGSSPVMQIIGSVIDFGLSLPLEPFVHTTDGMLTYAAGVVAGFMDVLQNMFEEKCKLPDITIKDVGKCACGDNAHTITQDRAQQGFKESAFWCVGTLQILKPDGKPKIIFNPYTYAELKEAVRSKLDLYLDCIAKGQPRCSTLKPKLTFLERQGVDVATVFNRCRSNYVNMMWDVGAARITSYKRERDLRSQINSNGKSWMDPYVLLFQNFQVQQCLATQLRYSADNDVCLLDYLSSVGTTRVNYFMYEKVGQDSSTMDIADVDACEVFTGPAKNPDAEVAIDFQRCVNAGTDDNCSLPHYLWSGRTSNKVPVATIHSVSYPEKSEELYSNIFADQLQIQQEAIAFFNDDSLTYWSNPEMQTSIFSIERDIIHQFFDCNFIGPYASAELFPSGANQILPVIKYYRKNESTREFEDPKANCDPAVDACCPEQSPFSCGGPGRKAILHNFIHSLKHDTGFVGNTIQTEVRNMVQRFRDIFTDTQNYGCSCDDGSNSVRCCSAGAQYNWSNPVMRGFTFDILETESILDEIFDYARVFVNERVFTNDSFFSEFQPPWTSDDLQRAADEGLLDFSSLVGTYEEIPVMNVSLWKLCTDSVSVAFLTLPVTETYDRLQGSFDEFDPVSDPGEGYVNAMQKTIEQLLQKAKEKSPFYRTVHTRYMPSKSSVCRSQSPVQPAYPEGNMTPSSDNVIVMRPGVSYTVPNNPPTPVFYGRYNHALGDILSRCLCGWYVDGQCAIPQEVCQNTDLGKAILNGVPEAMVSRYDAICVDGGAYSSHDDWRVAWAVLHNAWNDAWACPDYHLSDHWGIVDDNRLDYWMAGSAENKYSWHDAMLLGTSGTRLGNLQYLTQQSSEALHPATRIHKTFNPYTNASILQEHCIDEYNDDHDTNGWKEFVGDTESVYQYFLDNLFPMQHIVHVSSSEAFCTRYVVEEARYRALQYVFDVTGVENAEIATQKVVADMWRTRCVTQTKVTGLCHMRGVFNMVPNTSEATNCPFQMALDCETSYVTNNCLVYCDGVFYDPCACQDDCEGYIFNETTCAVRFDPRVMVDESAELMLSSMHWPTKIPEEEAAYGDIGGFVSDYEDWKRSSIIENLFSPSDLAYLQDAIIEGSKREGKLGAADTCDGMLDYWPEEWLHPTGYHVSTVCTHEETAHRGYDTWMRVKIGEDGKKTLVLESQRLRNESILQNYFGGAGVCSAVTYGMALVETNNMRLQSRWRSRQSYDPTEPIAASVDESSDYVISKVAESINDVPVRVGDDHFNVSTGLLHHFYPQLNSYLWPMHSNKKSLYKLPYEPDGWGDNCGILDIFTCESSDDCKGLHGETMSCLRTWREDTQSLGGGVCVKGVECFQHYHCPSGKMCDGLGMCVTPYVAIENHDSVKEFMVSSETCTQETLGTSPWQNVPDLFERHGMCGFRSWNEYQNFMQHNQEYAPGSTQRTANNRFLWPSTSPFVSVEENSKSPFERGILSVKPHVCDVDHQFRFPSCVNEITYELDENNQYLSEQAGRDTVARTYRWDNDTWNLYMCDLRNRDMPRVGFLGNYIGPGSNWDSYTSMRDRIKMCDEFQVCFAQPFTVQGWSVLHRRVDRCFSGSNCQRVERYNVRDSLYCGATGYLRDLKLTDSQIHGSAECKHDPHVNPLLDLFCNSIEALKSSCDISVLDNRITETCRFREQTYFADFRIQAAQWMNEVTTTWFTRGFETYQEYQRRATCAKHVWTSLQSISNSLDTDLWYTYEPEPGVVESLLPKTSLYLFSESSSLEIPFQWWVQCVLLDSTVDLQPLLSLGQLETIDQVYCQGWENSKTGAPLLNMDIFLRSSKALYIERDLLGSDTTVILQLYHKLYEDISSHVESMKEQLNATGRMSYVRYRKIDESRLKEPGYVSFAEGSIQFYNITDQIEYTSEVTRDDGEYEPEPTVPSIFDAVVNYILHGDVNKYYFQGDTAKLHLDLFAKSISNEPEFLKLGADYFSVSNGLVRILVPNLTDTLFKDQISRIVTSMQRYDAALQEVLFEYAPDAFLGYDSLSNEAKDDFRLTSCLNVGASNLYKENIIQQLALTANVRHCNEDGKCSDLDVCASDSYDKITGQPCNLMDPTDNMLCKYTSFYWMDKAYEIQPFCSGKLAFKAWKNVDYPYLEDIPSVSYPKQFPNGSSVCLRTDSPCLNPSTNDLTYYASSTSISTISTEEGVKVHVYYREGGTNDANANDYYSPLYQLKYKTKAGIYPYWVDCFGVPEDVRSNSLEDFAGGMNDFVSIEERFSDIFPVITAKQRMMILTILYQHAVFSDSQYKPSKTTSVCTGGQTCNVGKIDMKVSSIAIVYEKPETLFCASSEADAILKCPAYSEGNAILAQIKRNWWICKKDCQKGRLVKYVGGHAYRFRDLGPRITRVYDATSPYQSTYSTLSKISSTGYILEEAFDFVFTEIKKRMNADGNLFPINLTPYISTQADPSSTTFMNSQLGFKRLNLNELRNYDMLAARVREQGADNCVENEVDIKACTNPLFSDMQRCRSDFLTNRSRVTQNTLVWRLSKEHLTSMHTVSWSESSRPQRDRYIDWALDGSRCSDTLQYEAVCYSNDAGRIYSINPWSAGTFSFYEGCDVQNNPDELVSLISSQCRIDGDCTTYDTNINPSCPAKNNQPPQKLGILSSYHNNLCKFEVNEQNDCTHNQGFVGGGQGEAMQDLYVRPVSTSNRTGIFGANPNPLYQSKSDDSPILRQSLSGIIGTFQVLTMNGTLLTVRCLPSVYQHDDQDRPDVQGLYDICRGRDTQWLKDYEYDRFFDFKNGSGEMGSAGDGPVSWDCPIREMHYWGGSSEAFRPRFPFAKRSQVMFSAQSSMGNDVGNGFSSPVQKAGNKIKGLVDPIFISEICTCSDQCQFPVCDSPASCAAYGHSYDDPCLLHNTLEFLLGETWKKKGSGSSGCSRSLDWPHAKGVLRDGYDAGRTPSDECSVHDRLREYEMKYKTVPLSPSRTLQPGASTLHTGGSCHMGRLPIIPDTVPLDSMCRRFNLSHLKCVETGYPDIIRAVSYHELILPVSASIREQKFRRKCSQCDKAPRIKQIFLRAENGDISQDSIKQDEVSFGVPVRISSARIAAMDLRRQVCGESPDCPLFDTITSKQAWGKDQFMQRYLQNVSSLFKVSLNTSVSAKNITPISDEMLWSRPWAFCTQVGMDEETGKWKMNCSGSVPKSEWMNHSTRFDSCKREMLKGVPGGRLMVPIRICNLDNKMNTMCQKVEAFKQRILRLNCMAAGLCRDTAFLYNPAAYSVSNQNFITETVTSYYKLVNTDACTHVPLSNTAQQVIDQNNQLRKECPAILLQSLREDLFDLRKIITSAVKMGYYFVMVGVSILKILVTTTADGISSIIQQIKMWFDLWVQEAKKVFQETAKLIARFFLNSPVGKFIMQLIKAICQFINWLWVNVILNGICGIIYVVSGFIRGIGNILKGIHDAKIPVINVQPFRWVPYKPVLKAADKLDNVEMCKNKKGFSCDIFDTDSAYSGDGTLPTPTRCWASYISSLGDSRSQSCAASDTCLRSITSNIDETVVCDACPNSMGSDFNRFGCDMIRKQCSCSVQVVSRTSCMTHEQCINDLSSQCVFINDDIQQTFGNVPCSQCNNEPMCIIQAGQTYGACSCTLSRMEYSSCRDNEVGSITNFALSGLCLVEHSNTLGATDGRDSTYMIGYSQLLATPCYNVNQNSLFCYRVYMNNLRYLPLLVSSGLSQSVDGYTQGVFGRRRLLQVSDGIYLSDGTQFVTQDPACLDQLDIYMQTNKTSRVLQQCLMSFAGTHSLVHKYNLTEYVSPSMFVSTKDFVDEVINNPISFITLLIHPAFLVEQLSLFDALKPIRAIYFSTRAVIMQVYFDLVIRPKVMPDNSTAYTIVIDAEGKEKIHGNASTLTLMILNLLHRFNQKEHNVSLHLALRNSEIMREIQTVFSDVATMGANVEEVDIVFNVTGFRRLLESWKEGRTEIQRYTSLTAFTGTSQSTGAETANDWSNSIFAWPITYDYGKLADALSCGAASATLDLAKEVTTALVDYFQYGDILAKKPKTYVFESWPFQDYIDDSSVTANNGPGVTGWLKGVVLDTLSIFGITPGFLAYLLERSPTFLLDIIKCDRDAVILCSKHSYTLMNSGIVVLFIWAILYSIGSGLGLPFVGTVLALSYFPIVMYHAYGYSITCAPLVPTCFLSDVIEVIGAFFPEKIYYPESLQRYPGCIQQRNASDCILTCSAPNFEYDNWEAVLAWWLSYLSPDTALSIDSYVRDYIPVQLPRLHRMIAAKVNFVRTRNTDMISAQTMCAVFSTWMIIPVLIAVFAVIFLVAIMVTLPLKTMEILFEILVSTVIMTHAE